MFSDKEKATGFLDGWIEVKFHFNVYFIVNTEGTYNIKIIYDGSLNNLKKLDYLQSQS